ncbi:MAG: hypothetical protein WCD79_09785, partial [Chthoniobacteraceae bacterium]
AILTALVLFIIVILFLFVPVFIHTHYRSKTPDAVMKSQREEYSRLENSELHLTGVARIASEKKRDKLYLWFHARGFPIDEGDGGTPLWQDWSDLFDYWRSDNE